MAEWEQLDALMKWLQKFELDTDDFLDDSMKLLNCRVLTQVFNKVSDETIDLSSLRPVASDSDWVNILLDLRLISSRITPLLKQIGVEVSVDLTTLAKKRDETEFFKFMKFFFFYCMKAPNRKEAISRVRQLEKPIQLHIQHLLEELKREKPKQTPPPSPKKTIQSGTDEQSDRIEHLRAELKELKEEEEKLAKLVEIKSKEGESEANIQAKMEETLNAVRSSCIDAEKKGNELKKQLQEMETKCTEMSKQITDLDRSELEAAKATKTCMNELTVQQLEEKLELMKQRASAFISECPDLKKPATEDAGSIIESLELDSKQKEIDEIEKEIEGICRRKDQKNAEIAALKGILDAQQKKASKAMLRRIDQLSAEMDKSPLGEAKRTTMRYRLEVKKLGAEIEKLEKEGGRDELAKLQEEVQRMASIKAREGEQLAKKLAFMQSTVAQCGLRLKRLKLDVELQTSVSRLRRWRNCF